MKASKRKGYNKKYYDANKEKIKVQTKKYREDHPEIEENRDRKEYDSQYNKNNKDKVNLRHKEYRKNNPLIFKKIDLRRYHNITVEQYDEQLNKQDGKCAICHRPQEDFKKRFCVDHDHVTNKIRGILCDNCNLILGHANDDTNILSGAIQYIEKYKTDDNQE